MFIQREFYMSICDYKRNVICHLYDNRSTQLGQAYDVFASVERNGWKELSFSIPTVVHNNEGEDERNFVLDYLKSDYYVRTISSDGVDFYLISEQRISHNGYKKTLEVTCPHIAQLLKYKKLGMEFSDSEGNNIGTAEELLYTILEGTGWNVGEVYEFRETRGPLDGEGKLPIKKRSLVEPVGAGAFKMISDMCDLFEAKPVYHGDTQKVDIIPLNPFENVADLKPNDEVLEIHYGKNLKNISRILDTSNMVTRLYAQGSYGDTTNGYCSISECNHTEHTLTLTKSATTDNVYTFTIADDAGVSTDYYFTPSENLNVGDKLILSFLDPASMMYLWKAKDNEDGGTAYPIEKINTSDKEPKQLEFTLESNTEVPNLFSSVMDFTYYRSIGLFNDEMLQKLGKYQRKSPALIQTATNAAKDLADSQSELSQVIGNINFCKLAIQEQESNSYLKLKLDTENYPNGVIYRSDYDVNKKNYFKWRPAEKMDQNGDPVNAASSILYIIHNTAPISWDITYLKELDDADNPKTLTFWLSNYQIAQNDSFYLFSYNGVNGILGSLQASDESAVTSLEKATTIVTEKHDTIFTNGNVSTIEGVAPETVTPPLPIIGCGWVWHFNALNGTEDSTLYFCYNKETDKVWKKVWFTDDEPLQAEIGQYWYDWRNSVLGRKKSAGNRYIWEVLSSEVNSTMLDPDKYIPTLTDKNMASLFSTVYMYGKTRDRYYMGVPETITYTVPDGEQLPKGNYFFKTPYDNYYVFSTDQDLNAGDKIEYTFVDNTLTMTINNVMDYYNVKGYRFDNVKYHKSNIFDKTKIESGSISTTDGSLIDANSSTRSSAYSSVVPLTTYNISGLTDAVIHCYNAKKTWMKSITISNDTSITIPDSVFYIKITKACTVDNFPAVVIAADNKDNIIIIDNLNYVYLDAVNSEKKIGILSCMSDFKRLADQTYQEYYATMKTAQKDVETLEYEASSFISNLWKEGRLEDSNYVDGDEYRLYDDAVDTVKKLAKPDAQYNIGYIDLYGSNMDDNDFSVFGVTNSMNWPDVNISTAIHLVDPELEINEWAYIDKIRKCYDQPKKTEITINTNLTTVAQHTFGDLMSTIADVATQVKIKASKYDSTSVTSVSINKLEELLADLVTMSRISESAGGRIVEMENAITGHSSMFKQTADEISAEVRDVQQNMNASLKVTAEGIYQHVEKTEHQIVSNIGYEINISAENGSYVSSDVEEITLKPIFKYAGKDILDEVGTNKITWTLEKESSDGSDETSHDKNFTVQNTDVSKQRRLKLEIKYQGEDDEEKTYTAYLTIMNLDHKRYVEVFLTSNHQNTQVYNNYDKYYSPDWSKDHLVITPTVYVDGQEIELTDSNLQFTWTEQSRELDPEKETVTNGELTVSQNVMSPSVNKSVTYILVVTYGNGHAVAEKTFSLIDDALTIQTCDITGPQAFRYDKKLNVRPASITLTASPRNCKMKEWLYKNGNDWSSFSPKQTGEELTIYPTANIFTNDQAIIKASTDASNAFDIFTIHKVYDGTEYVVAYLTNENMTFAANAAGQIPVSQKTFNIVAYVGSQKVTPGYTPGSAKGLVEGMNLDIGSASGNELPCTLTIANGSTLGGAGPQNGTITIPIQVDTEVSDGNGETVKEDLELELSWSKVCEGKGISDVGEWYITTTKESDTPSKPTYNVEDQTFDTGNWKNSVSAAGFSAVNKYLWNVEITSYSNGDYLITDPEMISVFSKSISDIKNYYRSSAENSTPPSVPDKPTYDENKKEWSWNWNGTEWDETPNGNNSTINESKRYLWNFETIYYDDLSTPSWTAPCIVGVHAISAKSISISGEHAFKYPKDTDTPIQDSITLTAAIENMEPNTKITWQYKNSDDNFVGWTEPKEGSILTVRYNMANVFNNDVAVFKASAGGFEDIYSIYKIYDGDKGNNAVLVFLDNEHVNIPATSDGKVSERNIEVTIIAYDGSSEITAANKIVATGVEDLPSGLSSSNVTINGKKVTINIPNNYTFGNQGSCNGVISIKAKVQASSGEVNRTLYLNWIKVNEGNGIDKISEYYLTTSDNNTPTKPTYNENTHKWDLKSWKSNVSEVTFDETNRYLWNIEMTSYTDGRKETITDPRVISVHSISAKNLSISGEQTFKYNTGETTPTPASITLTALAQNDTGTINWQYKDSNSETGWSLWTSPKQGDVLTIDPGDPDFDVFVDNIATFRAYINEYVYDIFSVYKVYDGTDAVTIYLDNESVSFIAGPDGAVSAQSFQIEVVAYEGTRKIDSRDKIHISKMPTTPTDSRTPTKFLGCSFVTGGTNGKMIITFNIPNDFDFGSTDSCHGIIDIEAQARTKSGTWVNSTLHLNWVKVNEANGIDNVQELYVATKTNEPTPTINGDEWKNKWVETIEATGYDAENKYLWNYEKTTYTDGRADSVIPPHIIAVYATSISGVDEWYLTTSTTDEPNTEGTDPTVHGWKKDPSALAYDQTNKYLWNFEVTNYTDGNSSKTKPIIIGSTSVSVIGVEEFYKATTDKLQPSTDDMSTWFLDPETAGYNATNKYLWNCERLVYGAKDVNITRSTKFLIGTQNAKVVSVTNYYKANNDNVHNPAYDTEEEIATWDTVPPSLTADVPYLWSFAHVLYAKQSSPIKTACYMIAEYSASDSSSEEIHITNFYQAYRQTAIPDIIPEDEDKYTYAWKTDPTTLDISVNQKMLWNYKKIEHGTYEKGEVNDPAIVGVYGRTIDHVTNYYLASNNQKDAPAHTTTDEINAWATAPNVKDKSVIDDNNPYLWNFEQVTYDAGDPDTTDPCIIAYFTKGIASIEEYYYRKTDKNAPTVDPPGNGWVTSPPTLTSTYKYLWNMEIINYSDGSDAFKTKKRIIAQYSSNGRSVSSITNFYQVTDSQDPPSVPEIHGSDNKWKTDPKQAVLTSTNRYLWNYEFITYSDGTPSSSYTTPAIIGVYGDKGKSISGIKNYYRSSGDGSNSPYMPTECTYDETKQEWNCVWKVVSGKTIEWDQTSGSTNSTVNETNEYLWNFELVLYDDNSEPTITDARVITNYALPAKDVSISGEQTFKYAKGTDTASPSSIELTAALNNFADDTTVTWSYKNPSVSSGWTNFQTGFNKNTLTIDPSSSAFIGNIATVKASVGTTGVQDIFSVYKVYDGTDGKNAITVFLDNESVSFAANANGVVTNDELTIKVIAYEGTTKITANKISITSPSQNDLPKDSNYSSNSKRMSVKSNSNDTIVFTIPAFDFGNASSCNGIIDMPVQVTPNSGGDPVSCTLHLNWIKVNEGKEGNGIDEVVELYLATTSDTPVPGSPTYNESKQKWIGSYDDESVTWETTISGAGYNATKKFLWNCEITKYTGKADEAVPPHIIGSYGTGISSIQEWYITTENSTPVPDVKTTDKPTPSDNGWKTDPSDLEFNETNKYMWNFEVTTYTDGTKIESDPIIIGTYSERGVSVSGVKEWYYASDSSTPPVVTADIGWWKNDIYSTKYDQTNRFLLNTQKIIYSDGTVELEKRTDTLRSSYIKQDYLRIVYFYQVTDNTSTPYYNLSPNPNLQERGWVQNPTGLQTTKLKKYLWRLVLLSVDRGSTYTSPGAYIIGGYGADNVTISSVEEYYYASIGRHNEGIEIPNIWKNTPDETSYSAKLKYLWNCEQLVYTDGTTGDPSTPAIVGVYGKGIASVTNKYRANNSITPPEKTETWDNAPNGYNSTINKDKQYLWNYEIITYNDGTTDETDPCIVAYFTKGIASIQEYYLLTDSTTAPDSDVTTWPTSPFTPTSSRRYLWNAEVITYSDGSTPFTTKKRIIAQYSSDGTNNATVTIYKRSSATNGPALPTKPLTYNFSNGALTEDEEGALAGWSQSITNTSSDPVWMSVATASSTGTSDTIAANEWSSVIKFVENGYNQATILLYQRSSTSPSEPSGTIKYTFSDGSLSPKPTLWSTSIPPVNADHDPCYVTSAAVISYNATANITGWSDPVILVEDGIGIANVKNYYKATSTTYQPDVSEAWDETPGGSNSKISESLPYLWNYEAIYYKGDATPSISTTPCIIGSYGISAKDVVISGEQTFKYNKNNTVTPEKIYLTATKKNTTKSITWKYKNSNDKFQNFDPSKTGNSLEVIPTNTNLFNNNVAVFRAYISDDIYDDFSIYKIYDGTEVVTTFLDNENISFAATPDGLFAGSTFTVKAIAYEGNTELNGSKITVGTVGNLPGQTGKKVSCTNAMASNQRVLTFTVPAGCNFGSSDSCRGAISIPLTIASSSGNVSRTLYLSWIKVNEGNGVNEVTELYLATNDNTNTPSNPTYNTSTEEWTGIWKDKSGKSTTVKWKTSIAEAGHSATNKYLWNCERTSYTNKTSYSVIDPHIIGVYSTGISSIQEWYQTTTDTTVPSITHWETNPATDGWYDSFTDITFNEENKYMWNFEITTYTDTHKTNTDPVIIGTYGNRGVSVNGVKEFYYASSSGNSPIPLVKNRWENNYVDAGYNSINKYLWNTQKVTYSDGTVVIERKRTRIRSSYASISSITCFYQTSNSSSSPTIGTTTEETQSGYAWSTDPLGLITSTSKKYLWKYTRIKYENDNYNTPTGICIGIHGATNVTVSSVEEWYYSDATTSDVTYLPNLWITNPANTEHSASRKYLWNCEQLEYSDGSIDNASAPAVVGVYGRSIVNVENKYKVNNDNTNPPTKDNTWENAPNADKSTITTDNKYLWNYEIIKYEDGATEETTPCIIASYIRSISSVEEQYAKTETASTPDGSEFGSDIPVIDAQYKYLWNRERIKYSENDYGDWTTPVIIGKYGADGKGITKITNFYQTSSDGTNAPTRTPADEDKNTYSWKKKPTDVSLTDTNKFLWNYEKIEYTTGEPTRSDPAVIGVYGNPGLNNATVTIYKRAPSIPNRPQCNATYTFSTGVIAPDNTSTWNGWIQSIPDGPDPVWVSVATASSTGSTDVIKSSSDYTDCEWSSPIKFVENGTKGYNQATLTMYQRSASKPAKPTSTTNVEYTFSDGSWNVVNGWSKTIPDADGNPCYVTSVSAISQDASVIILGSQWSDVVKLVEDGAPGAPGKDSVRLSVFPENGTVIKKNLTSLTFTATVYEGSVDVTSSASSWTWKKDGTTVANSSTENKCIVNANDVDGSMVLTCTVSYKSQTYTESVTVTDKSDVLQAYISEDKTAADCKTKLICTLFFNGEECNAQSKNSPIQMSQGYLTISGSEAIDITKPTSTSSSWQYACIECQAGDCFYVNAYGGRSPRAWGFLDASKTPMSAYRAAADAIINNDLYVIAPEGSAYFVVNNKKSVAPDYVSYYAPHYEWKYVNTDGTTGTPSNNTNSTYLVPTDSEYINYVCVAKYKNYTTQGNYTITKQVIVSKTEPSDKYTGMLWVDTSDETNQKLKRYDGTAWQDVTVTSDQLEKIKQNAVVRYSDFKVLADEINSIVSEVYYTEDGQQKSVIGEMKTTVSQKADSWQVTAIQKNVNNFKSDVKDDIDDAKQKALEEANGYTDNAFKNYKTSTARWQRFTTAGLEIGEEDSSFKSLFSNTELGFWDGNDKVSYINNKSMYITDAKITNSLDIGYTGEGYFTWVPTPTGLGMKWKRSNS